MDIAQFKKQPVLGIIRGAGLSSAELLAQAIIASGLRTVEVTMNTLRVTELIKCLVRQGRGKFSVGAGTVLRKDELLQAADAGAEFIVSPVFVPELAVLCEKKSLPFFPGALTPHEIYHAWESGASMIKVFPSRFFGPAYFKELKGPFPHVPLMACGGVNADNAKEYFACGAKAIAFGAGIFKPQWLASGNFEPITQEIKKLLAAI